jgi:NTE family protein
MKSEHMTKKSGKKHINLALQGGGAHGAFTWGVLDYILEDGRLEIDAISGTSAGAMNAVALADGMLDGGAAGARAQLERFWKAISSDAKLSPVQRSVFDKLLGVWSMDNSPGLMFMEMMQNFISPYDLNPTNINPIKSLLEREINFENVRKNSKIKIFVAATNVRTGKIKIFNQTRLDANRVMASACLPSMFQAIEIDGESYWDGGYMGNPALFPFYQGASAKEFLDILVVQINPIERKEMPRTSREIADRVNEITFNSSLLREFRAIEFVKRLIEQGKISNSEYAKIYIHRISALEELSSLTASSKLNAEWGFFTYLRDHGRNAAKTWLDANFDAIGEKTTIDLLKAVN